MSRKTSLSTSNIRKNKLLFSTDDGIIVRNLTVIKKTEEKNVQTDLRMADIDSATPKGTDMSEFVIRPASSAEAESNAADDVSSSSSENRFDISSFRLNNTMCTEYTVDTLTSDGRDILYSSEKSNVLVYRDSEEDFETTYAWYYSFIFDMIWLSSNVNAHLCTTLDGIHAVRFHNMFIRGFNAVMETVMETYVAAPSFMTKQNRILNDYSRKIQPEINK
ncbi:unnamed protein product [Didymodactylos carnosus]|uniref:Uncharacterized protein n=1 Tax=Didymodactylos carnosus TaxID=1234261 RepID=A0A814F539_9BILA|nr:unnamed protein product [Didymodactylos carnosus]CAF1281991.1 unnamed protein product [Didymodactylos carnosus]CAF3752919.1 unnamed protein product [Didymodactylos carnosus]CAF4086795.1 unnamed protein product [Didymodactylos carnosus]